MKKFLSVLTAATLVSGSLMADKADVDALHSEFLHLKFGIKEGAEEKAEVARLHEEADKRLSAESADPEELIVRARILAYHASVTGGMQGLAMVKESKALLEKSIELDENAMDGYGRVLLGILYYRVPSWPVAFGDKKQARENLERAVEISPSGYESNYSLAEFLLKRKKFDEAKPLLEAAKNGLKESDYALTEKQSRIGKALGEIQEG